MLVSSLAVDWPFGVGLRLYIEFAKAVDYDVGMDVACAVIAICMGADQSLMPRKISLCVSCHVSISEKDLWNGINKELHQRMEEHRDLQKLVRKSSGKSKLQLKEIATKREIEQASGNIVRLESQKRSGYEQYVLGKLSKEKFLELKQGVENEIVLLKQTKSEREKELAVVQEELQQKKQIAGNTEVLLTVDNLLQYVKKIEVDRRKMTYTEFVF